tara:strand:+ start:862 stop:1026 length:165 start_codon:yes stop_codon:yes gene_type:complete
MKFNYFDPQNPEFCKKMVAKYGEDWDIDDFSNDTSDDFILKRYCNNNAILKELQ